MVKNKQEQFEAVRDGDQSAVIGQSQEPKYRAGPGEGVRAPLVQHGADHAEFSIFDGAGNERVVVLTTDDEGRASQGVGSTSEEAMADARRPGHPRDKGFTPPD